MPFFDEIGKKITAFSQDVANQSKTMADTTRWNQAIAAEEKKKEGFYRDLGKQYYDRMRALGTTPEEDTFLFTSIDAADETIFDLKKKISQSQGKQLCPKCGAEHSLDARFCTMCGSPLGPETETAAAAEQQE